MTDRRRLICAPAPDEGSLDTSSRAHAIAGKLEPDDAAFVLALAAERAPPWRRRQDRLDRRDELIRQYARERLAELPSDRSRAKDMAADLALEPILADPVDGSHRVELRRILELSDGKALSAAQIRDILAGGR